VVRVLLFVAGAGISNPSYICLVCDRALCLEITILMNRGICFKNTQLIFADFFVDF
jgi:hypothetical protein